VYALDLDKNTTINIRTNPCIVVPKQNTHLALVLEANLPYRHATIFLQVTPWRIHNGNVIFLVSFDTVCLCQLRAVDQQFFCHFFPVLAFREAHVDMSRGQIIDVKPNVLIPAVFDQLFIYESS